MPSIKRPLPSSAVGIAWAWLGLLVLAGGTAQYRDGHNIVIEVVATLLLAGYAWRSPALFAPRGLMLFAYGCAAAVAIQLLPLPFNMWKAMPGHERYAGALAAAAIPPVARPWTISPDPTLAALTGLLPVFATIIILSGLDVRARQALVVPATLVLVVGAVLGMLQLTREADSSLRLYRFSTEDGPTGFFSNRNHHALSLAIGIAMSCVAVNRVFATPNLARARLVGGVVCVVTFTLAIVVAGSRGALLATVPALVFAMFALGRSVVSRPGRQRFIVVIIAMLVAGTLAGIAAMMLGQSDRALAVTRLWHTGDGGELRWRALGPTVSLVRDFFPFGAGYGTFDTAFRAAEPLALLKPTFLNEAHNEPLQVLMEGGVIGLALLVIALAAIARAARRAMAARAQERLHGWLGCVVLLQLGLVSLFDYPLRTPLLVAVAVLAFLWMKDAGRAAPSERDSEVAKPAPMT